MIAEENAMTDKKETILTREEERELLEEREKDGEQAEEASFEDARAQAEQAADDKEKASGRDGRPAMPKPTFSTFVLSLASSALVQLGEVPDPATGKTAEDILLAKHSIDILAMLKEKVEKGLDAEETRLLEGLLYELRMKYVVKK